MTGMTVIARTMINIGIMTMKRTMTIVRTTGITTVEGDATRIGIPQTIEVSRPKHGRTEETKNHVTNNLAMIVWRKTDVVPE